MKIESHMKALKESITVIEECVEKGVGERQRTIGFSTSAAAVVIDFHRLKELCAKEALYEL